MDADEAARDFDETMECMRSIGLQGGEQDGVFQMLAGILHLGNVCFVENEDEEGCLPSCKPRHAAALAAVTELLEVDYDALVKALSYKTLSIGNISQTQTSVQATENKDSLAKTLYTSLFQWLVLRLNQTIAPAKKDAGRVGRRHGFIGILDIFGFEIFKTNSFYN